MAVPVTKAWGQTLVPESPLRTRQKVLSVNKELQPLAYVQLVEREPGVEKKVRK